MSSVVPRVLVRNTPQLLPKSKLETKVICLDIVKIMCNLLQ